jgi:hypothetical protein
VKCPICQKPVSPVDPYYPFCCERCKLLDLGNWASERYVISSAAPITQDPSDEPDES